MARGDTEGAPFGPFGLRISAESMLGVLLENLFGQSLHEGGRIA